MAGQCELMVTATRNEEQILITVQNTSKPWSLVLRGIQVIQTVSDGTWQKEEAGVVIKPQAGIQTLKITL